MLSDSNVRDILFFHPIVNGSRLSVVSLRQ